MFNFKNFFKVLCFGIGGLAWFIGGAVLASILDHKYGFSAGMLGLIGYMIVAAACVVGYQTRGE